jgi:hypothetical protein
MPPLFTGVSMARMTDEEAARPLERIGREAFSSNNLTGVVIPASVAFIGERAKERLNTILM